MSRATVANARRSQLVSTYGVGALFPAQNESFMIMGLENWSEHCPEIVEPRLARALGVAGFKAPAAGGNKNVPVIRFPEQFYCPKCRRLGTLRDFDCPWHENSCPDCKVDLVPSRFITCCARGHIDDFPYFSWLHPAGAGRTGQHRLSLKARGRSSSLSDIAISCSCGIPPVTMEDAFNREALAGMTCKGRRPWLGADSQQDCSETPRTLQRGSSNVWFPVTKSVISIPPWSEGAYRMLDRHWKVLQAIPVDAVRETLTGMDIAASGYSVDELEEAVLQRRGYEGQEADPALEDLRAEEYRALCRGKNEESRQQDFVCEAVEVDPAASPWISHVSRVSRLREVRATQGFTRILPPTAETPEEHLAALSLEPTSWLPALEVIGEGVFLRLDESELARWEETAFALSRAEQIQQSMDRHAGTQPLAQHPRVTARQLLLHGLAHALIDQLSLDAGYPAASLRERIYGDADMAGILVYTATSDSAGSLGGLAAQSAPNRFALALVEAASRMSWCSSDPVCIESVAAGVDARNLAACHACLLLPETSCEMSNTLLDRAVLVGTPQDTAAGFLSGLIRAS